MKFVFFFGFNRCGSSATGMVLDAHPNAIVANEFDIFGELVKTKDLHSLLQMLCSKSKKVAKLINRRTKNGKGYSFRMGENHGVFDENLKLIGVRKSVVTINHFIRNSSQFQTNFQRLVVLTTSMLNKLEKKKDFYPLNPTEILKLR